MIADFYKKFCNESFDENGVLKDFEPIWSENFNFAYDVIDAIAELEPERRALVWCNELGEEKFFTFGDMKRLSDQAANLFVAQGIKKGDMVLLMMGRNYQFWYSILALHKIGAVAINSTYMLTTKDLIYRFNAAGISHLICTTSPDTVQAVEAACKEYDGLQNKFLVAGSEAQRQDARRNGWIDFNTALTEHGTQWTRKTTLAQEPLLLYFTSGTTGNPKMAWHDHTYPLGHLLGAKYWHNIAPDGLHLTVADTGWAKASWGKLYGQWFLGCSIFVYDFTRFDAAALMDVMAKHRVTSFCAPPTIYRFLIKTGMEAYDLSSIKHATTAGEALNAEVFKRFKEHTGLAIMEAFGQSETTAVTANLVGTSPKPGSMGRPSPLYKIDLIDENGESVADGEVGELVICPPNNRLQVGLFRGYYKDDELTTKAWEGGVYHTGDTAWRDEEGYLWYVGRTDDVIKASGYRIGPFEIESVLMEHPAVMECAVTGVEDSVRGMVVKATIVLTAQYKDKGGEELTKELQQYVKKQTAPYKYPRIIEYVPELPKTFSGKIQRAQIRRKDQEKSEK